MLYFPRDIIYFLREIHFISPIFGPSVQRCIYEHKNNKLTSQNFDGPGLGENDNPSSIEPCLVEFLVMNEMRASD